MGAIFKDTRKHLMTGVSYMIPFVVAGGVLLALSVMLFGEGAVPTEGTMLYDLFFIGVDGLTLMIPFLAGFIAFSIADRPGIAPAAIAALTANQMGAGFLGALIAGLLGGVVVYYIKKIKVPSAFKTIMPILVIPIVGTFITAGAMKWGLAMPIAALQNGLTAFLTNMSSGSLVALAIIMGLMDAFDMGGPVNKVAYAFTIMSVGAGLYHIGGINAVGVTVAPLGMGIAALLAPKKYSFSEREAGKAAIVMSCMGITEGAIPFAAADPLRVIPSIMAGTAVGTALAAIMGVQNVVAWGGLIVLPAVIGKVGYVVAILAGAVVTALLVNLLKKEKIEDASVESSDDFDISFS